MRSKSILQWFDFADTDLALAEHALSMKPQPFEIICYHCQQAAEKYLKGYLIYKGLETPPKIHDLVVLNNRCIEYEEQFEDIQDECETLTQYGVQPRYPDEVFVDETHMNQAINYAKRIKIFDPIVDIRKSLEQESENGI